MDQPGPSSSALNLEKPPVSAFELLPEVPWISVMERVADPLDRISLSNTDTQLFGLFGQFQDTWLMEKIITVPEFQKRMGGIEDELMKLRQVCKTFRLAIDKVMRDARKLTFWHDNFLYPPPPTIKAWNSAVLPMKYEKRGEESAIWFKIFGDTFLGDTDLMIIWYALHRREPHINPFPAKSLALWIDDEMVGAEDLEAVERTEAQREHFSRIQFGRCMETIAEIAEMFGSRVEHLKIYLEAFLHDDSLLRFWNLLVQVLQKMPNLKELALHVEDFNEMDYQLPLNLPSKVIKTLALTGCENPISFALFQAYAREAKRLILDIQMMEDGIVVGIPGHRVFAAREVVIIDDSRFSPRGHHQNQDILYQELDFCMLSYVMKLTMEWDLSRPSYFLHLICNFRHLKYLELVLHREILPHYLQLKAPTSKLPPRVEYLVMPFISRIDYMFLLKFPYLRELTLKSNRPMNLYQRRRPLFALETFSDFVEAGQFYSFLGWRFFLILDTITVEWEDGTDIYKQRKWLAMIDAVRRQI